jgi:hypothetical protein
MLHVNLAKQSRAILCYCHLSEQVYEQLVQAPRPKRIPNKFGDQPCRQQVVTPGLIAAASRNAFAQKL